MILNTNLKSIVKTYIESDYVYKKCIKLNGKFAIIFKHNLNMNYDCIVKIKDKYNLFMIDHKTIDLSKRTCDKFKDQEKSFLMILEEVKAQDNVSKAILKININKT